MDDPFGSTDPLFGSIVVMFILTIINAFLAGAEMAFVSLNPGKIKDMADKGDKKAQRVQKLLQKPDSFLSAIQVGITFAGFFNSASASQAFASRLAPLLGASKGAITLATLIVTLLISYVSLVLGELYPKQLALQIPEKYARSASLPIMALLFLFRPFIALVNLSTGLLKKLTPIDFSKKEEKLTRSEMSMLLKNSTNDGAIDLDEFNMMRGVLSLDSRLVTEIMVPRVDAFMLDVLDNNQKNLNILLNQTHSRVPLYEDDRDAIIGIVHLRDVVRKLPLLRSGKLTLRQIVRPALFIPETLRTDELLLKFKSAETHMAIIVDEFGGMEGIVTLDDLMSEIVGDIPDEYSEDEDEITKINEREFLLKGSLTLSDFNEYFDEDIETEDADTLAGFLIEQLGFIPGPKDEAKLTYKNYVFVVRRVNRMRIELIKMEVLGAEKQDGQA